MPPPPRSGAREHANKCGPGLDRQDRRCAQWDCLRTLWKISTNKRHAFCRRFLHGDVAGIEKRHDRASYTGLQTCGWVGCPCCGPKIAAERAADIALALTEHYSRGGTVALVTLTLPHSHAQRLSDLLDGLGRAWTSIRQNKTPRKLLRAHTDGWIKRLEVTVGPNGWHPHLHLLVFLKPGTSHELVDQLSESIFTTWSGRLVRAGLGEPSEKHGIDCKLLDLSAAHEKVAEYLTKSAALEVAAAGTKIGRRRQNRTPLQLLHDVGAHGLAEDLAKWHEYEKAMTGRKHVQWSAGLRARLIGELPELTDEQAAENNDGAARLLAEFGGDTWARISKWKPGPAVVLNWAEVYDDDDQARDLIDRKLAVHQLGQLEAGSAPAHPPG